MEKLIQSIDSLSLEQNGHSHADITSEYMLLDEKLGIFIPVSQ